MSSLRALSIVALAGAISGCPAAPSPSRERALPSASVARVAASPSAKARAGDGPRRLMREARGMGTSIVVTVFAPGDDALPRPATASIDAAFAVLARLERAMSTWIPESELSEVNREAARRPVRVGADTMLLLEKARWASELSKGAFDVTFEVMHGLWRFDQDLDGQVPSPADVAKRRADIDYTSVSLDSQRREVSFRRAATKVNLGGIAKGYALDRMADELRAGGLTDFLVQAGGDLYAHGKKPDGSPWIVGVRDPRGPEGSFFGSLAVEDHAFSTAGDYERAFVKDGRRYHHIIDPRTGYPAAASRSVTVWASDAFTADAIDDAIFILGPKDGLALCESVAGCGAVLVDAANKVWVSKRLEGRFQQQRPPTDGL